MPCRASGLRLLGRDLDRTVLLVDREGAGPVHDEEEERADGGHGLEEEVAVVVGHRESVHLEPLHADDALHGVGAGGEEEEAPGVHPDGGEEHGDGEEEGDAARLHADDDKPTEVEDQQREEQLDRPRAPPPHARPVPWPEGERDAPRVCLCRGDVEEEGDDKDAANRLDAVRRRRPVLLLLRRRRRHPAKQRRLCSQQQQVRQQDQQPAGDGRRLEHKLAVAGLAVHEGVPHAPAEQQVAAHLSAHARRRQHEQRAARLHGERQQRQQRVQRGRGPPGDLHRLLLLVKLEEHAQRVLDEGRDDQKLGNHLQPPMDVLQVDACLDCDLVTLDEADARRRRRGGLRELHLQ
mmetsp:Transcript_14511/g.42798  ORF Transcript_14511/g.42798 Transcript_14511/m.42798 type:complete len:350 (-) Transcript_14511:27-1076(-)